MPNTHIAEPQTSLKKRTGRGGHKKSLQIRAKDRKHLIRIYSCVSVTDQNKILEKALGDSLLPLNSNQGSDRPFVFGVEFKQYIAAAKSVRKGTINFINNAREVLTNHDEVFVRNADELACFSKDPACIQRALRGYKKERTINVFFKSEPPAETIEFLTKNKNILQFRRMPARRSAAAMNPIDFNQEIKSQLLTEATPARIAIEQLVEASMNQAMDVLNPHLNKKQKLAASQFPEEKTKRLKSKYLNCILKQDKGPTWIIEQTRREILYHVFQNTIVPYSSKDEISPKSFFEIHIKPLCEKFSLPSGSVGNFAFALHHELRSQKQMKGL